MLILVLAFGFCSLRINSGICGQLSDFEHCLTYLCILRTFVSVVIEGIDANCFSNMDALLFEF